MKQASGSMIFVSGLSGAGKSTLIHAVLGALSGLAYLRTVTTRPKRAGEENSLEYEFVSGAEYDKRRAQAARWDHTEYAGNYYGADVDATRHALANGTNVICAVTPDVQTLEAMKRLYGVEPITIWVDTPEAIAKQRIAEDTSRSSRQEDATAKQHFAYVFRPTGRLQTDKAEFVILLEKLLTRKDAD